MNFGSVFLYEYGVFWLNLGPLSLQVIHYNLFALEKGSWTLTKNNDWCYIGSLPIKSDLPESKKRGDNYILVYKIIGSDENIVLIFMYYGFRINMRSAKKCLEFLHNEYIYEKCRKIVHYPDKKVNYDLNML